MPHFLQTFLRLVSLAVTMGTTLAGAQAVQSPAAPTPDFSLSSNPSSLTIQRGASATSTILLRSRNLIAVITLSPSATPSGLSVSVNPTVVLLVPGGSNSSTLTVSTADTTPLGSYTVTVSGTNGLTVHQTNISVLVVEPDFSIALSSSTTTMVAGSNATATVKVSSLHGFAGTVNLTSTASPSDIETTVDPTSLMLSPGTEATSMLNIYTFCSTPAGVYSIKVTGSATGVGTHTGQITVTVQDSPECHLNFTLDLHPASLNITAGSFARSNVTLTSWNRFTGNLTVQLSEHPNGLGARLTLSSVFLKPNMMNSTAVVIGSSITSQGRYNITVSATNGTVIHSAILTVVVTPYTPPAPTPSQGPSSQAGIPGGLVGLLLGNALAGGSVAMIVVLLYLKSRTRRADASARVDSAQ